MSDKRSVPDDKVDWLAMIMATLCNGGQWHRHYTEAQRDLWRKRARRILAGSDQ